MDEWAGVKAPPPPEVKSVTLDPKTTALLLIDIIKQTCNMQRRPRCVAMVPKVQKLLAEARAKDVCHTPGHTSFAVQSVSGKLLIQTDVTNLSALFVRHPDWHLLFDMDGDQAEQTRRKFFDMAVAEKTPIQAFHHPFPGLGHVEKDGSGYRWVPEMWLPTI
jgi:hypothetical protein